jgi:hypothetical protein
MLSQKGSVRVRSPNLRSIVRETSLESPTSLMFLSVWIKITTQWTADSVLLPDVQTLEFFTLLRRAINRLMLNRLLLFTN